MFYTIRRHIALAIFATGFMALGFIGGNLLVEDDAAPVAAQVAPVLSSQEQVLTGLYDSVSPSVVAINVFRSRDGGSGSGFVIDNNGHILTNYHVVQGALEVVVNFLDGTITRAEIVGLDPESDLAVIKVDVPADRLAPVQFGNSLDLAIGQSVIAIGSPFGQRWTMTSGIVSALERSIESLGTYQIGAAIQTDAAINPGNSGGPLLNLSGEVVGVNSQIISETRSNAGIGFAVPSNLAQRVASELIQRGQVQYSFIGIGAFPGGGDVNLPIMEALGLQTNQRGVVVGTVSTNGPARAAGIQEPQITEGGDLLSADIIVAIDGKAITGFDSLISHLAMYTLPGDTVSMTILRDGSLIDLAVTLGNRPNR